MERGHGAWERARGRCLSRPHRPLTSLSRATQLSADDTRGGWKGSGKLKGGWAAGKDLGEVPKEERRLVGGGAAGSSAADNDDMPSSTSSWSDAEEVAHFRAPDKAAGKADKAAAAQRASFFAAGREGEEEGGERKRKREKGEKKAKKHKSEKNEKSE